MYTQCPDCSTAFRVTATVLKQAAGKVRCGGCGHAFNALEYLSETMPDQPAANEAIEDLPELKPEPLQRDDGLPASISAEQSAALLKTLDELAGSDIRIEDTGVEWRVLDDDELGDSPVDEILEDSPTPVDQFLTDTPAQIDSPEIFDEDASAPAQTPVDELRFDDNTPLPDDFDFGDESPYAPPPAEEPADEEPIEPVAVEPQADVDLSEPDEWTDILGEFDDLGAAEALPLDAELAALDEELADEVLEEQEAEASDEPDEEPESAEEPEFEDELQLEEDLEVADELDVDDEPTIVDELESIEATGEVSADEITDDDAEVEELLDMDTQFALQAEAMGIDLSGIHDVSDEGPAPEDEPTSEEEPSIEELLSESDDEDREIDELLDEELVEEVDADEPEIEEDEESAKDEDEAEQLDLIDEAVSEDEEPLDDEPEILPMSEEEQTINMQIDAELMAVAVEDKDGLASTIIIPDGKAEEALPAEKADSDVEVDEDEVEAAEIEAEKALKDTSAGFETIIMEGEEIRSGHEKGEVSEEDKAAAAALVGAAAAEREAERKAAAGGRRWGLIAGIVVLALILALQAVHQKRDVLAKIPQFNNIVGPLYRAIGQPLAPEWEVRGWLFEVTRHVVQPADEADEQSASDNLLIYSRLGNSSDEALPYPIIIVSLSDRFEEPMGSVTLDPGDYLPSGLDPRKLVSPGNSFEASMTVESPPPEATSFRLRACYRAPDGDLRCKDQGFK